MLEASSVPDSVSSPANPGFQDSAPPQSQALQGGPTSQPSQPLGAAPMPLEGGGRPEPVGHAEAGGSPLQDQTTGDAVLNGKGRDTPEPSKGRGTPQEGAGPTASAKDCPEKEDAAQGLEPPESKWGSEPQKEPQAAGQQAGAPPSGVSCQGSDEQVRSARTARCGQAAVPSPACLGGAPLGPAPGMVPLPQLLIPLAGLVAELTLPPVGRHLGPDVWGLCLL